MRLAVIFIAGLVLFSGAAFCQLNSRLDLEAGYFNNHNPALKGEEDILLRAEGELSYNYPDAGNGSFNANLRLRPEWSGVETALRSVKMGAQAGYFYETEVLGLGFTAAAKRNLYNSYKPLITHDLLSLQGDVTYSLPSEVTLRLSPGYFRQIINFENRQTTDLLSLKLSAGNSLLGPVNGEEGIYAEFFTIRELPGKIAPQKESSLPGWKIGPELNFTYSEESILTFQYHFLLVNSGSTKFPSYEQMVRFMAGIMPEENISVMLMADYFWHNIKVRKSASYEEAATLNYSSLNYENRILLKIGYDVTEDVEVYLRTGYSKENLINDIFSEKSWSIMAGLSFTR